MADNNFKILDCTLRDGGYYTKWDFESSIVTDYISSLNKLPIDFIEVGYKNISSNEYQGEFYYCPKYRLEEIKAKSNKKIAVMIDEKNYSTKQMISLLDPCKESIDLIRLAVDPLRIKESYKKVIKLKSLGIPIACNFMYLNKWERIPGFFNNLKIISSQVEYIYLVDSFGSIYPHQLKKLILKIKQFVDCKVGFHGHNNLELAFANTLVAIENGVDIVDSTVIGMGRGAGNLKTELLISHISKDLKINFNALSSLVDAFSKLHSDYNWGTNLPYMLSGVTETPQKLIMEWLSKRYLSLNSIVNKITNFNTYKHSFPKLNNMLYDKSIIIGGGSSIEKHIYAILEFLNQNPEFVIVFSSTRYFELFQNLSNFKIFCFVGDESERIDLSKIVFDEKKTIAIVPSESLETIPTRIPENFRNITFEIESLTIDNSAKVNNCSLSLQAVKNLSCKTIFLVGFDGYEKSNKVYEIELFNENDSLFKLLNENKIELRSLTPTTYKNIIIDSIYSYI